jgi:hypothetical protein
VRYWNLNTDGNNEGLGFDWIRMKIRSFEPDPGMTLSTEERSALCPQPGNLRF